MMQTRRKSKAAGSDDPGATLNVDVPPDIDEDALLSILPEVNLGIVSTEDVANLYRIIATQVLNLEAAERERDDARAEIERKDVELDQALQDKEGSTKELEQSLESLQAELSQTKQEKDQLSEEKSTLQAKLSTLSTSQSSSSSEVDALRHRVDDTEREKRDLMGVVSRLKDEGSQREEEVQTLRANLKEARQEHQALETQVRELRSTETANKFKVDSLTQQLQLAQAEVERTNNELNEKTEEFTRYRRTKHAELATLQASFDSLTQSQASIEASYKALQSAHTAQSHQLTQALSKVQALTGQLAEQEARYSNEASGLKRLVAMMEEREKQAKEIVDNVEQEWATVGEKAERREGALRDEIEGEKKRREEAEKRLEQLEVVLERVGRGELPVPPRGAPGSLQDPVADAMLGLSPTVAMASKVQRGGKTFTEIYADYVRLQEEYARKSAEYDHMDRTLSSVLAQIEERAPILSQQRVEYERLQSEASQLGSQLAQALSERDNQAKLAQDQSQKLAKATKEIGMLQKSLDDVGQQVRTLTREITRRDDPTIPSDDDIAAAGVQPATDTESLITNNLVKYVSIDQLQEVNQRLLKIVREMGDKMESEERDYREAMEKEQAEAIKEAHEAMQELADQLERQKKSSDSIIQAYVKERDTLRGMLARSEKNGVPRAILNGDSNAMDTSESELAKELVEVQGQYEAYRTEMGHDSNRLREELSAAQREVNTLGAALAKANAKIEFMSDRARMHEEQFQMHNQELTELTKRNRQLLDQWTRMDIECNRVTEDFHIATGRVEQLRNECANLRAEKKIWESIQGRLVEENRTLAMERSHLSDLMANVQKMHNDLERSGENDRRRLEGQLQMLDAQTQELKAQVYQERDNARHVTLQKEIEIKELQGRLDRNVTELSKTRETLIEAQTSRKHLEERLDGLTRQMTASEEKLSVYERRGSSVTQIVDPDLTREQQLEAEVADLRSALKVAEVDLASAKSHKEQFEQISRASEAALQALNMTFDEYKASAEAQIARHESEYTALRSKLEANVSELNQLKSQFNEAQKTFEAERTAWINDKKTLEDTIVDMTTSEKHSENDRSSREHDIRSLEDRAKAAEEKYSHEIIAHAETLKSIDALKKDLSIAQATARDQLTAAETAQAKLAASESSWKLQKDALDKEVADLDARCKDLASQNSTLHQHLESVSSQATRIRQAADAVPATAGEVDNADADTRLAELRTVVSYLRNEKGIVDLQLEMSKQENERLKSHIDHLTQTLQESRATLAEERERAVENTASAAQHAELVERINQLNILRESNATLRTEYENASKKARDLESKLSQLSLELDPAKEQARSALAELEVTRGQMIRLEQESRRWQERNVQLLSKYDRVDPAEIQALKDELERCKATVVALEEEKKAWTEQEAALTKRKDEVENALRLTKETASKNMQTFKNRLGDFNAQKSGFAAERKEFETKIATLEQELQTARAKASEGSSGDAKQQAQLIESLKAERDKLVAEKDALAKAVPSAAEGGAAPASWEAEREQLVKAKEETLEKLKVVTADAQKAMADMKGIKTQNEKFQVRLTDLMKSRAADAERQQTAINEAVEKAKAEAGGAPTLAQAEDLSKRHAEELRALEAKLKAEHEAELKARLQAAIDEAAKSKPGGEADQKAAIETAIAEYEQKMQVRHAEDIAAAVDRGRLEAGAKGRLKDAQLLKAQKRVKELEAQLIAAGVQPAVSVAPTPAAAAAAAGPQAVPAPTAGASAQASAPSTPLRAQPPSGPATRPVPAAAAAAQAAAASTSNGPTATGGLPRKPGGPTATRGGAIRGRGAAPTGPGRGGAPQRIPPVKQASQASVTPPPAAGGGMSIMGAANKRPREEAAQPAEDSLAKRMKPAP